MPFIFAGNNPATQSIPLANILSEADYKWRGKETGIAGQTKTFYLNFNNGGFGLIQIAYSDPG